MPQAQQPTDAAPATGLRPGERLGLAAEMQAMPPIERAGLPAATLDVSLLIPARGAAAELEATVRHALEFLTRSVGAGRFELVLIPNPALRPGVTPDRSIEVAQSLARQNPEHVRVAVHRYPQGKGAALRTGFLHSRGRRVFFTDADLPYKLEFFSQAQAALDSGFDLVTGNRRLESSTFDLPVGLLKLAYARHRLGLLFNRTARLLMPLATTDTQAGIKAMSRELATEAFSRQSCPGFFFDLELLLTARAQGMRHAELPVTLFLNSEKSTVRVMRESVLALFWLARISLRDRLKRAYGPRPKRTHVLAHYHRARPPLGERVFLELRWRLTPYSVMASKLPPRGRILDLGSGHGLFAAALALASPDRQVVGLDHDLARVELARRACQGISNLKFEVATLSDPVAGGQAAPGPSMPSGISMIDVMHYFSAAEQERLFAQAYALLAPGGTLIVREVNPSRGLASSFNQFYEKVATLTGFTRSEAKAQLTFRTREEWEEVLSQTGFEVSSERCSSPLFADILYICRKPRVEGIA